MAQISQNSVKTNHLHFRTQVHSQRRYSSLESKLLLNLYNNIDNAERQSFSITRGAYVATRGTLIRGSCEEGVTACRVENGLETHDGKENSEAGSDDQRT